MLSEQELNNIFSWQPYRPEWPVNRNLKEDNIIGYFGELITSFTKNKLFDCCHSQDGGLSNYLEFICYPGGHNEYDGASITVCVSLCAPFAVYGQTTFIKKLNSWAWDFINADSIGLVTDSQLKGIENEIKNILLKNSLLIIDKDFASNPLSKKVIENLKNENHNEGTQYLHGLFQVID